MENTMNTWLRITFVVTGRMITALFIGALLGTLLGVLCGALCGAVFALMPSRSSWVGFQWDDFLWATYLGLWFGAMTGACVGFVSGLCSFLLHSLIHLPVDSCFTKRWRRVAAFMLKLSLIGSFGGGFSGMMIGLIYQVTGSGSDMISIVIFGSCPSHAAGFFYGSISGFFGSLLLAALFPEQLERAQTA